MDSIIDKAALVYFNSPLAMSITDKDKRIISVNSAFCNITGYKQDEIIGFTPKILSSGKHDANFYNKMWAELDSKDSWSGEVWNKRKNGELFLESISISIIRDEQENTQFYFAIFSDITKKNAADEAIYKLTFHDELTSLPNRRLFMDRLEQNLKKAIREQSLLTVLFIDVDNFKDINDSLGHDSGDLVIKEVATRLNNLVRETDTVARLGGDEFTVCLNDIKSINNTATIAQSILDEMVRPFQILQEQLFVSVSIGIALYPDNASTVSDLLKYADQAMFTAKESGRNKACFFTQSMQEHILTKQEMITDLHEAISQQDFSIHYQPIIELSSGKIHKAEALLRWQNAKRGWVSPADFIPIAESSGMISEIGDWVFKQATQDAAKWRQHYYSDFQISINKSPKQFQAEGSQHLNWYHFLDKIGLTSSSVVVEITEGLLVDNSFTTTEQLHNFRQKGMNLALDDFGTGYSSLAYLKKFDIDFIKIDRSFVKGLKEGNHEQALCEAIIVMAHKLGIKVIAEGIETEQQLKILVNADCDYGQGFIFSKAKPHDQFEQLLSSQF